MPNRVLTLLVLAFGYSCTAPASEDAQPDKAAITAKQESVQAKNDLKPEASSYRSDWGRSYPSGYNGYGASGYGNVDNRYGSNGGGYNSIGYNGAGYSNYDGYKGYGGYGATGYDGYAGNTGYGNTGGYGGSGYGGYGSYGGNGYSSGGYGGNGGYGGYGGNGGLTSYYGYNDPNYRGSYHLGYGYYNRRPSYGNIYSNNITPSLVTGYRGYSRR